MLTNATNATKATNATNDTNILMILLKRPIPVKYDLICFFY